jgi:predicted RND superfamily exporter protein
MQDRNTLSRRMGAILEQRSGWFLLAVLVATALLAVPMFAMAPDQKASDNPGGPVFDVVELLNNTLPPRTHEAFFIVEARDGDFLTQAPLWELYQNSGNLRKADQEGKLNPPILPEQPYLYSGFATDRQQPILGIYTIADAVQKALAEHPLLSTDLEHATDEQVKFAVSVVLGNPQARGLLDFLSQQKTVEGRTVMGQEIDYWTAPAMLLSIVADNEKLGGGALRIGATTDPVSEGKERFNRKVQAELRGEESTYRLWGLAIDVGLETEDEVGTAVPFISATFFVVLIVVGVSLRSARVILLTGLGLAFMIVWLKGLSNLVGLNSSTTLDFIVPIAMISLGANFAIHAVNRYREERRAGLLPRHAFRVGMAGVLVALALAMVTDAVAFLSNAAAEIETVVGFGIGAGLAIVAGFIILGLAVPIALMRMDARRETVSTVPRGPEQSSEGPADILRPSPLAMLVVVLARWRLIVLPLTALLTIVAAYYALQMEATFDVEEFFRGDSDFAIGLDRMAEHVGDSGGEPALIYIRGDLANPAALMAIQRFVEGMADNPYVAKNTDGQATLPARTLFAVLDQVMGSPYARAQIEQASGVSVTDGDDVSTFSHGGQKLLRPDSREQLTAIYDYISVNGIPKSTTQNIYDALEVTETLFHDSTGALEDATSIMLGIPGTREQTNVIGSRDAIERDIRELEAEPAISFVGLTGSPYTRQAGLDATSAGLRLAFIIALIACFLAAVAAMRSLRFAVVTIIPIGLVVAWLYAFMYLFGFGLNFITATIAAVSIGVGIDYSIHMTQRYREELPRAADKIQALRQASQGTGMALVASAATSVLGFTIMAFAPMPMFSSYGILTAVMIFLAAAAALLVLPSLLLLVTTASTER